MSLSGDIRDIATNLSAEINEKNGVLVITKIIAERKAFLTTKKLVYAVRILINDGRKEIIFTDALKETGFGLFSGENTPGFGFKSESYKTRLAPREGRIEEQSNLIGKRYQYSFDFSQFRGMIEDKAVKAGYAFLYKVF